uniref:Uncharacterized protein n=1 Tax=Panagrolaimus sp. PS1159 TaxID=55785 RepID=A0AC35EVK6_9BILA
MVNLRFIKSKLFPYEPPSVEGYTLDKPYPQRFPYPTYMIKYITMNPTTPKLWKKLVKTCKYFYSKNPIIIRNYFSTCKNDEIELKIAIPVYDALFIENSYAWGYMDHKIEVKNRSPGMNVNEVKYKVWLTERYYAYDSIDPVILSPKIYRNDAKIFSFYLMTISFEDLITLSWNSKLESLVLFSVTVKDKNGKIVTVENICEAYSTISFLH